MQVSHSEGKCHVTGLWLIEQAGLYESGSGRGGMVFASKLSGQIPMFSGNYVVDQLVGEVDVAQ